MTTEAQKSAGISPPDIVETVTRHTAVIHLVIPRSDMPKVFGPAIQELVAALVAQGTPPTESAFAHHFKITADTFDFEIGFTTPVPVTPTGRIKAGVWSGAKNAHTVYTGPYEGLPSAWGAFTNWMKAEGLAQASDLWEHYVIGPHASPDPKDWQTHLYRPLTS